MQQKLKAKGIFLDLDGTLVDSTQAYLEAAKTAFQAIGKQAPSNQIMLQIPKSLEQRLSIEDITGGCTKQFLSVYLQSYHTFTERKTTLLPNVAATLQRLAEKSKLALITMRYVPSQVIQKELDYFGVAQYFSHIATALDTAKPKPSPEALIRCVKALNLDMRDCLIAGDSITDMRAGKAAGAKTVAVLSGLYRQDELALESPDLMLPNVCALPEHVE
jgi:HAD superfamily hydrolase (TIGR01549 family)